MKKIKLIIFLLIITLISSKVVFASSVSIKVSSGTITKGETVTVTAVVSADSGIYTTEGTLSCSGAGASASANMGYEDMDTKYNSKSFPLTIKATTSGTITCTTSNVKLRELAVDRGYDLNNAKVTIKVNEPVVIKKPTKEYSSNNYLKSLEVEGYELTPTFNKETKEYTLEVPNGTEKVNIKADKENGYAKISGTGEIKVNEGINKIEIKVTAENGNERIYILNITVKELNPIEVVIDKNKYNIIRKEPENITIPSNYEKSTITMNEEEVLCYKNSKTNSILMILQDEKGNNNLYTYDEKTKKYTLYNSLTMGDTTIGLLDMPSSMVPKGYSKVSFKYNNNKIDGYQYIEKNKTYAADDKVKGSDFFLIYGINEKTGEKALYVYDKLEGTIQRFNEDLVNAYKDENNKYFLYMLISLALLAISIITLSIVLIKQKKNKKGFA